MCGILFVDTAAAETDIDALRACGALSSLSHRGPEAYAELVVGSHILSFHRLAIVHCDDAGMQPFVTDANAMICSGEIYNYLELHDLDKPQPRSDVDVILELFKASDNASDITAAVARLDGDFAFVMTDGQNVVAGRDPFGVRPLFYVSNSGTSMAFASEAKALCAVKTFAEEIRVFPPGFICVNGVFSQYYNNISTNPTNPESSILSLLTDAVEKRIRHSEQHDVAVLCSGGIDSAALTCIATALNESRKIRVFTMRYASGHSDDAFYASLLCRMLGVQHDIIEFSSEDLGDDTIAKVVRACETCDPNTIRAAIPMYILARRIRELAPAVKVVLSGEGADELFGGYSYFRLAPNASDASIECGRLLNNIHQFDLLRADRCFAAHGLEVRVPFLDTALVEYVRSLPIAGEKQLLRDAVSGFDVLSRSRVLERPKEKFSDGAGFSYVPDLLRRISAPDDDGTLESRLRAEADLYSREFVRAYGAPAGRWVIERTMPSWTDEARSRQRQGIGLVGI